MYIIVHWYYKCIFCAGWLTLTKLLIRLLLNIIGERTIITVPSASLKHCYVMGWALLSDGSVPPQFFPAP